MCVYSHPPQVRRLLRPNQRVHGRHWPGKASSESSSSRSFIDGGSRSPPEPFSSYCWLSICCKVGVCGCVKYQISPKLCTKISLLNMKNSSYSLSWYLGWINPQYMFKYKLFNRCYWSAFFLKIHMRSTISCEHEVLSGLRLQSCTNTFKTAEQCFPPPTSRCPFQPW